MGLGAIYFAATGESHGFTKDVGYGFGWLGLVGLAATIFLPATFFRKRKWVSWSATLLIACGYLATASIMAGLAGPDMPLAEPWWFTWLLGGPAIVGAWNLFRIWKRADPVGTDNSGAAPLRV